MQGAGESLTIWVAMGAGVLSFLSPCVLPIFPSYLSFVTGLSLGELSGSAAKAKTRRAIILNSLCFILGFSVVFMALGASFSLLGRLLFDYQQILRKVGGALVILFGVGIATDFYSTINNTLILLNTHRALYGLSLESSKAGSGVVDATGAGDLFAAGFLVGMARGADYRTSARLGALVAAEVIQHLGARPETSLKDLARDNGFDV